MSRKVSQAPPKVSRPETDSSRSVANAMGSPPSEVLQGNEVAIERRALHSLRSAFDLEVWQLEAITDTLVGALARRGVYAVRVQSASTTGWLLVRSRKVATVRWLIDGSPEREPLRDGIILAHIPGKTPPLGGRNLTDHPVEGVSLWIIRSEGCLSGLALDFEGYPFLLGIARSDLAAKAQASGPPTPSLGKVLSCLSEPPLGSWPSPLPVIPGNMPADHAFRCLMEQHRTRMVAELSSWSSGGGPEALHQARVAGRRLRVLLKIAAPSAPVGELIRSIDDQLGSVRNLDVTLAWLDQRGASSMTSDPIRAKRQHQVDQLALTSATQTLQEWTIETDAPIAATTFDVIIGAAYRHHLKLLATTHLDSPTFPALHAFRRRLRRYRYLVEAGQTSIEKPYVPRKLTSILGALSDAMVIYTNLDHASDEASTVLEQMNAMLPLAQEKAAKARTRFKRIHEGWAPR